MERYFRVGPGGNNEHTGALMASALWLRLSFAGASAVAAGLALLFGGESSILLALGLVVGGSAVAILAWRRAVGALDRIDAAEGSDATAASNAGTKAGRVARSEAAIGPAARAITLQPE